VFLARAAAKHIERAQEDTTAMLGFRVLCAGSERVSSRPIMSVTEPMTRRYIVVSPVRNEEEHLKRETSLVICGLAGRRPIGSPSWAFEF